jgi:hypothetical protein
VEASSSQLLEESVDIAWVYLQRTGDADNGAARHLTDTIEAMDPPGPAQPDVSG